jgi:DNA-directed RNA polymerase specialized sigma subunit
MRNVKDNIFKQYIALENEVKDLDKRIKRTEKRLEKIRENGTVKDLVYGGDGGNQPYHIEGFPTRDFSTLKTALEIQQYKLEAARDLAEIRKTDIMTAIDNIPDSESRTICRMYFLDGKTQAQIAMAMCMDQSSVCRKLNKYGGVPDSQEKE